jgi:hypothetical protein
MKTVTWTDNTSWEEAIQEAEREEVLVMRGGHAVALVVPFDDDDLQWYGQERDPHFIASLAEARGQVREGRTVAHNDLRRELGLN